MNPQHPFFQQTNSEEPASPSSPLRRKDLTWVKWITPLVLILVIPLAGEILIRLLCPFVNYQGADHRLFKLDSSGNRIAWKEGAQGICFGQEVQIDEYGCLDLPGSPPSWSKSLLILGDSVSFGTGVPPRDSFAGLLQAFSSELKVWNASVVGMDMGGYPEVLRRMLQIDPSIREILLFYCLNDIYYTLDATALNPVNRPDVLEWILDLFRKRSKLFLFLKGSLLDRSRGMFLWDYQIYRDKAQSINSLFTPLVKTAGLAGEAGIPLTVVLLPYEYQLRAGEDELWLPQNMVKDFLCENEIPFLDMQDCLEKGESHEFFLFADGMHLSKLGHEKVFRALVSDGILSLGKLDQTKENTHEP